MKIVFADTFYFLALLHKNDQAHKVAVKHSAQLQKIVTTEWVMTEVANAVASARHRSKFLQTRQELVDDDDATIVRCEMNIYESGLHLYASRPDKDWSLTDCISFVVMQQHSTHEALTGDHHFEQAGFVALLK